MYPFGHLGFTLAFFHSSTTMREKISTYALVFGTLLPDLIDKSYGQFIFKHGRFVGHSFVIGFIICFSAGILLHFLGKDNRLAPSLLAGWTAHLVEDSGGFLPLFYPVIQYSFPIYTFDPLRALSSPYVLSCEAMGVILLGILAYRYGYVDIVKANGFTALIRALLKLE